MTSPDAEEWLAAECYELDQLTCLDTYKTNSLFYHATALALAAVGSIESSVTQTAI